VGKFETGDVVRLKSGGPKMTVQEITQDEDEYIECIWFEEGNKMMDTFHPDTLEKIETRK